MLWRFCHFDQPLSGQKRRGAGKLPSFRRKSRGKLLTRRAICCRRGDRCSTGRAKTAAAIIAAAAVFLRQKQPAPYLQSRQTTLSSAVILTCRSSAAAPPSRKNPMTGFHHVRPPPCLQWRYRSGFAPDSLFSPAAQPAAEALRGCYLLSEQS